MIETSTQQLLRPSNPFATHRVRPGAIPFRFEAGFGVESFFGTLGLNKWLGQIVGPHGTGKSTLLKTLEPMWSEFGRTPLCVSLRNAQRRMPKINWRSCEPTVQVIVDGFEQLSQTQRLLLRLRCRMRKCGLLVTTHRHAMGIPVAYETAATNGLVRSLVSDLVDGQFDRDIVDSCFEEAKGNVRETFMLLYDTVV